ncbi:hypothetical protein Lser_V15G35303 [Lactuca serriola]
MAKLIALALAFTAFVAFASAHNTVVTTTIDRGGKPILEAAVQPTAPGTKIQSVPEVPRPGPDRVAKSSNTWTSSASVRL